MYICDYQYLSVHNAIKLQFSFGEDLRWLCWQAPVANKTLSCLIRERVSALDSHAEILSQDLAAGL